MDLYIFDKTLSFKGIIEKYTSLRWVRRYSKCGEFELHCGLTPENLELLKRDNIIWKNDDKEAGFIEYRNIKLDATGKEILVLKGKFLTGYLNRRIIWGIENLNTTSENAMRNLVNKNCIKPTDVKRKIPLLELGVLKNYPKELNHQVGYKNLLDELESIAILSELGIRTIFDPVNKRLIFDVYKGKNLTASQTDNPPAIFSQEFENILEQEYVDSINNFRNIALVAGEGEGTARELRVIGDGTGLDRYELFVDARDLQSKDENDNVIPIATYRKMLDERGASKLSEYKEVQTFDSKINLGSNLIYKEDFDLGDIVTSISKKWRVTIDTRITEIEEIYEESGVSVNVMFGNNIPDLIDKIKQVVR